MKRILFKLLRKLANPIARALYDSLLLDHDDWRRSVDRAYALRHASGRFDLLFDIDNRHVRVVSSGSVMPVSLREFEHLLLIAGIREWFRSHVRRSSSILIPSA